MTRPYFPSQFSTTQSTDIYCSVIYYGSSGRQRAVQMGQLQV
jgi:hypothetical protein